MVKPYFEKNDIFTGIYDIGNGYTDLFDSKINFIIKCKSSEDLKNGINGITKTLTAKGMVTLDLADLKTVFQKTSKSFVIFEKGNLETFDDFISLAVILIMLVLTVYCFLVMSSNKHLKLMQKRQAKHRDFLATLSDDSISDSEE